VNNLKPSGPLDDVATIGGDVAFIGVDELNAPQMVAPGYVCGARNKRFRFGKCADREGISLLPWCKGDGTTPFGEVYGGGVFSDPNDDLLTLGVINEWILIAADGGVWKTRANQAARPVPLPLGVTLTRDTFAQFIQANGAIILLRGLNTPPLACYDLNAGFVTIAQENVWPVTLDAATNLVTLAANNLVLGDPVQFAAATAPLNPNPDYTYALPAAITAGQTYYTVSTPNADTFGISATPGGTPLTWNTSGTDQTVYAATVTVLDGALPIPNAAFGLFAQNRLFLINGKDTLLASDIGDFTRYQPATSVFRVNQGDSFTLQALYLFNESTLILFEDGVVRQAQGVTGDLSGATGPLNVTQSYGIAAPRGIADAGTDVYWLSSDLRIVNLQLTQLNQTQATDQALSDFLIQTFGRINAAYKDRARLAVFGGLLYCALPLDDAELVSTVNRLPAGQTYELNTPYTLTGLTPGQRYQWRQGANGGTLLNGTELLRGECDFTAQGTSVDLEPWFGLPEQTYPVTDQIYAVTAAGVNTAVAVYDFTKQAWCGTDEAPGILCPVDWLKLHIGGRQRLCYIGADGWLHLYGDQYDYQFEDEAMLPVPVPYVDLFADPLYNNDPSAQIDLIQVNNGTYILTANQPDNLHDAGPPDAGTWGISSAYLANGNLWQDSGGQGGFNPTSTFPWTAPDTTPEQIGGGVRFIATNGALPNIHIQTLNAIFTYYQDPHSGNAIQPVPIASWLRTRGYPCSRLMTEASYQSLSYQGRPESTRFTTAALALQTWAPNYTIKTYTQGAGDWTTYAENQTRNRLKYFTHGTPDWDPSNVNNDYGAPNREDYSHQFTGAGLLLGDGVNFDQLQEGAHRVPVSETGLWMQIDLANNSGHLEVTAVAMEAQGGLQLSGPQVK